MSDEYNPKNEWGKNVFASGEVDSMPNQYDEQYFFESEASSENASAAVGHEDAGRPIFRGAIRWLVYIAVFLVPLWFLPLTSNMLELNKQVLLVALTGIGAVLYLLDIIKSGIWKYRPNRLAWPIAGIVGAAVVSVIFSVSRYASVFGSVNGQGLSLLSLAALAVLFMLAINVVEDRGRRLRQVISVSLALVFLYGILQVLGVHIFGGPFAQRSFNTVGSFNAIGILAAVALGIFSISEAKKHEGEAFDWFDTIARWSSYIGFVMALFFVVVANWWVIWTVAFIALLASVAFRTANQATSFHRLKMRLFAPPLAIIVIGIFLMLVNFNWTAIKSKLPVEVAPAQETSWGIAFDALKSRPLGFGMENFGIAYDKFKPASIANTIFYQVRFTDATSEAANMVVEGGILMLLALLALFWLYGRELVVRVRYGLFNEEAGMIWAPTLALLAALFLYPFNMTLMLFLMVFLALAAISGGGGEEKVINLESDAKYSFVGSLIFIVGVVAVLVAGYFTVNNYRANILLAKAVGESDRSKAIEYYVESANTNPRDSRTLRLLSQTVLAQLADELRSGPKKDETRESYNARIQNQIASAVNISVRATNVEPADSQNWANRGLVYQNLLTLVGGADQAAINMYNETLARNPYDPQTYLRLGNLYLSLAENNQRIISNPPSNQQFDFSLLRRQVEENLDKAEENLKKAISLYNNFGQALYNLAVVYDRKGELGEAIKQFEKLQASNPRDPSIVFQLGLLYYRNGQKDNALRAWERAVFLFPNYSNARWYLSLILEERGNLDGALAQVKEIERLNPDSELVKQRLAQLESGKRLIPPEKVLDQQPLDQ